MEFKGCSAGSLAAKNDDGTQATFCQPVTSPCKHSRTGRDSTPQVLRFRTAWSGKRARLSLFSTSGSWNLIYRRCWIATQGYLRVFCFRNILVAKASKTFFLSLVQLIQPKIPAMLERDQAESGPHQ